MSEVLAVERPLGDLFGTDDDSDGELEPAAAPPSADAADEPVVAGVPLSTLGAVLAGLYELPPAWLLRTQTGWGRRVQYREGYEELRLAWRPLDDGEGPPIPAPFAVRARGRGRGGRPGGRRREQRQGL